MADTALMVAAPEVGIPAEVAKQLAPHAPTLAMIPLVVIALILIIIGAIATTAQNKTPGIIIAILGLLLGGGAFFVMIRTEGKKKQQ